MNNLYEEAIDILKTDIELNKKTLTKIIKENHNNKKLSEDEKKDITNAFNNFNKATLKYNKNNTEIKDISHILERLIKEKELDFDRTSNIVKLTKNNATKIEKTIKNDDDYFPFFSQIFKSYELNDIKNNKNKALFACVREIDRDNNTNVWRYKTNRKGFYDVINYMSSNKFWEALKKGNPELPDTLVKNGGTKSLSSKICKYISEEMLKYDNTFNPDSYYINDSVVRAVLLFYLDYYEIEHNTIKSISDVAKLNYSKLFDLLEHLRQKADENLTRNELDHILWYCYKSFKIKV